MTAATTPAPAYGPDPAIAGGENANPAAAGQADPYVTHPNPTKETIPMTDQMIPAAAIRAWRDKYRGCTGNNALEALDALLPPRPTMADMTEEERDACRWMQADTEKWGRAVIITAEWVIDHAELINREGTVLSVAHFDVTPRPDLPRMRFPGDQNPDSSLPEGWRVADHPAYGRVIVTNPTPDVGGHVYFVSPTTGALGNDWHLCTPDDLTYLDQGADTAPEVHPGVTVGEPVTDRQVMLGISIDAPDGTVVIGHAPGCHPKASVKSGSTWQSTAGMRAHLYHALGEGDYSELESLTVVRWGKEADQ